MNINRLIYPGFWFGKTSEADALELARRGVGGFCIYGGTLQSVRSLISNLRAASPLKHLFICADYEDGLGKWIEGAPWVLSNLAIGANGRPEAAYQKGLTLARQAREVGVDWVFAPVLDLCDEPQNPIVNTRSFGADPQLVGSLGAALCKGLHDGGVLNSIKHFPGHGKTTQDSHLGLPVLYRSAAELAAHEWIPFQQALPFADSIMAGHLLIPDLDQQHPASLSHAILTDVLQNQFGFTRLILTDSLCMKAIGDEKQAALQALHAGAHILLAASDSLALSDFLQQQPGLENVAENSISRQEALLLRLPEHIQEGLSTEDFNRKYAASCAVWQGPKITLQPGKTVHYIELGNEENFAAQAFLQTLTQPGISVQKFEGKADTLIAVSFSNYKAFKGHINLSEAEQNILRQAAAHSRHSIVISFGSPFGTENIADLSARLFLFSPAQEAQICAAQILLGQETACGKMPITLSVLY